MNDLELIELVAETDRYQPGTPLPELFGDSVGTLHDIERRAHMDSMERTDGTPAIGGEDPKRDGKRGWSGVWLAAAVLIAIVAVVGAVVAFTGSNGDVASDPPTTTAAPSTTAPGLSEAEARAVADAYFAAFAAGDLDAIMDLLAVDVEFGSGFLDYDSRNDFELAHAWNIAQQTTLVDVECRAAGQLTAGDSSVLCTYGELDSASGAVGGPPVGLQISMELAPNGEITRIRRSVTSGIDYNVVGGPFDLWMAANHPEQQDTAGCCWGETMEEAIARGETVMLYADLWAAYLEENGCVWDEPCEP